ncbi:MAG: isocitrate lyase/PEP mutase family protein [Burkholderiaceae bacterium]
MTLPRLTGGAARLRERLARNSIVVAPGAADALAARLVTDIGFDAVYMTGLGATASRLGHPDLGLLTQTEMAEHARAMVRATPLPVIADADTGYGGPLNIMRTVQEYAQAGVAALHIEDQVSPKRCGQLAGIRLLERSEAARRLAAAIDARAAIDCDLVIIGRTDALQAEGLAAALDRARAYRELGVDLLFVDGVRTRAEVEAIAASLSGPKVISLVDGTDAATVTIAELEQMGFAVVLYAVTQLFAAMAAARQALAHLKAAGAPAALDGRLGYAEYAQIVGLSEMQAFAHRHE